MRDNVVTTTLLHAILHNQHAITDALSGMADWLENTRQIGGDTAVCNVRQALKSVDDNRAVIGKCISEIMGHKVL